MTKQVIGIACCVLAIASSAVHAELYRWRDPQSGSIRFSNLPPTGYDADRAVSTQGVEIVRPAFPYVPREPAGSEPAGDASAAPAASRAASNAPVAAGAPTAGAKPSAVAAPSSSNGLGALDARRAELLAKLASLSDATNLLAEKSNVERLFSAYESVMREIEARDPKGALSRRASDDQVLRGIAQRMQAALGNGAQGATVAR